MVLQRYKWCLSLCFCVNAGYYSIIKLSHNYIPTTIRVFLAAVRLQLSEALIERKGEEMSFALREAENKGTTQDIRKSFVASENKIHSFC